MAFTPFVETDQPTMAAFNEKFGSLIEIINTVRESSLKIEYGYYFGRGKTNERTPISIKCSFMPYLVFIQGVINGNTGNGLTVLIRNVPNADTTIQSGNSANAIINNLTWDETTKSVSWPYLYDQPKYNFDDANTTYHYIAIG